MQIVIDIPQFLYKHILKCHVTKKTIAKIFSNGTPLPNNATNGQVLLQMFSPSVYFGDDEKHIVLLTKDCELTCYNNEWWNAPYERRTDD